MKKQILKIAGVKSEKEFYKKFPTEEAFMKAHGKAFKKAQIGTYITSEAPSTMYQPADVRGMYDELDYQLTGMTAADRAQMEAMQQAAAQSAESGDGGMDMSQLTEIAGAKKGKKIPKAQVGTGGLPRTQLGNVTNMGTMPIPSATPSAASMATLSAPTKKKPNLAEGIPVLGQVIGGIQNIKAQKEAYRAAKQQTALTDVMGQAAASRPTQQPRRRYVRPEDMAFQPEELSRSYGVGTNPFGQAEFGASVGGGEIANTFAPNTLYDNLGYEPLNDSERYKQFYHGGKMHKAQDGEEIGEQIMGILGSSQGQQLADIIGGGQTGGWSNVLGSVGGLVPLPGVDFGARLIGSAIDRLQEKKIENQQDLSRQNINKIIGQNFGIGIQQQFGKMLQDGGTTSPYKWVSHTWQPQKIVSFGGHNVKDLLKPPHDAEMLRAGGHLKAYTPPSPAAMSTERPNFQLGGELQTHWGGYAEPMSYNPYMPGTGETVMFRGQSHDESDGRGNTGIGITYGENPVEVERGEPMFEMEEGGQIDPQTGQPKKSGVVLGNIKITSAFADMLGDPKAKGKKFKTYGADLSKKENKINKQMEKAVEKINDNDDSTALGQIANATWNTYITGGNAYLKDYAEKKMNAAALQNAVNDTKDEGLLNVTDKGDVLAKKGASIPKAQKGLTARADVPKQTKTDLGYGNISKSDIQQMKANNPWYDWSKFNPANPEDVLEFQQAFNKRAEEIGSRARLQEDRMLGQQTVSARGLYDDRALTPLPRIAIPNLSYTLPTPSPTPSKTITPVIPTPKKFDWMTTFNQLVPYLRPSDAEALDPNQLIGEMYALATNQLEPVQAQTFQPQLSVPYDISLQDILNENEASYRAQQRMFGYNPAAQSQLNAQKYQANQRVLGEQFRLNQAEKQRVYEQNRNLLNQAQLQNLGILDQQYVRQQEALSKTKATTQAALSSIASKYAQNKLENRMLATMENLYNYRYDPRFRAINMNPLAQFDTTIDGVAAAGTPQAPEGYEYETVLRKKKKDSDAKNGSILKALKNL